MAATASPISTKLGTSPWHNITGLNPITGEHLHSQGGEPNKLVVQIDMSDPIGSRGPVELNLYEKDEPIWFEHPLRKGVDVVAIALPSMPGCFPHPINLMPTSPMAISAWVDAFIIGYPFGITTGTFPIWKRASIASEPEVLVDGEPYFFVDSTSRKGMSGSPVIARTWGGYHGESGDQTVVPGAHSQFLGVYSGRMGSEDELQAQLGRVWHAKIIEEIITGGRRGSEAWRYWGVFMPGSRKSFIACCALLVGGCRLPHRNISRAAGLRASPFRACPAPLPDGERWIGLWQPIGIHCCAVMAPAGATIDEQIAAAVRPDMAKCDGRECLAMVRGHGKYSSMMPRVRHIKRLKNMPPQTAPDLPAGPLWGFGL